MEFKRTTSTAKRTFSSCFTGASNSQNQGAIFFPSLPSFLFSSFKSLSSPFSPHPCCEAPLKPATESGSAVSSPSGSEAKPQPIQHRFWCTLRAKERLMKFFCSQKINVASNFKMYNCIYFSHDIANWSYLMCDITDIISHGFCTRNAVLRRTF